MALSWKPREKQALGDRAHEPAACASETSSGAPSRLPQQPLLWGSALGAAERPNNSGVKEPRPSPGGQEAAWATQDGQKHGLPEERRQGPVEGPRDASGLPGRLGCQQQSSAGGTPASRQHLSGPETDKTTHLKGQSSKPLCHNY